MPKDHIASLDKLYAIDKSDNAEIKLRFYQIALKSGPEYAKDAAGESRFHQSITRSLSYTRCQACRDRSAQSRRRECNPKLISGWVINKGRMKYCRPVFRLLHKQAPELAKKTFEAHQDFYHPIARKMIARDLGLEK